MIETILTIIGILFIWSAIILARGEEIKLDFYNFDFYMIIFLLSIGVIMIKASCI